MYILLVGIVTYIVESYGLYSIEVFAFLGINIFGLFVLFGLCYLHCVSALYVCRQSQVLVDKAPKTTVSLDRMKKELDDLVAKKGGIEHIESSSTYLYVCMNICIRMHMGLVISFLLFACSVCMINVFMNVLSMYLCTYVCTEVCSYSAGKYNKIVYANIYASCNY